MHGCVYADKHKTNVINFPLALVCAHGRSLLFSSLFWLHNGLWFWIAPSTESFPFVSAFVLFCYIFIDIFCFIHLSPLQAHAHTHTCAVGHHLPVCTKIFRFLAHDILVTNAFAFIHSLTKYRNLKMSGHTHRQHTHTHHESIWISKINWNVMCTSCTAV